MLCGDAGLAGVYMSDVRPTAPAAVIRCLDRMFDADEVGRRGSLKGFAERFGRHFLGRQEDRAEDER
ncbi:MAG TPA: hypothetical protein VFA12_02590 [Stellaceae bacterium]|jgi:hypothetical protein|nr:hypothetical protein [Stellaceae bacterium]